MNEPGGIVNLRKLDKDQMLQGVGKTVCRFMIKHSPAMVVEDAVNGLKTWQQ